MILVLGITTWPVYTKVVRAKALILRESEYVLASIALGSGSLRVIVYHVFPNLLNAVIVLGTLEMARAIIAESFLSFLGLGIQPPTPAWGAMLSEGRHYLLRAWWFATFPGLAIFITTLGINLLGDKLRDVLDPQLVHLGKI
jgi:peptide/nickel transport system permease protein